MSYGPEPGIDQERRNYIAYRTVSAIAGTAPPDESGPFIGYPSSVTSMARFTAGNGQMITASVRIAFFIRENGGPVDIQPGYTLVETESGVAYEVLDVRGSLHGATVATVSESTSPHWSSPKVTP